MADKIVTVQQLIDANGNCKSWEKYWEGGEDEDVHTIRGKQYPTHAKGEKLRLDNGGYRGFKNQDEILAYKPSIPHVVVKDLETFKLWQWDGTQWHDTGLSELDQANKFTRSSLMSGKDYPFKPMRRSGNVSKTNTQFADFILDVKVLNAEVGKFYKIELFMNGSESTVGVPTGWGVGKYDIEKFENSTVDDRVYVIHPNTSQKPIDRSGVNIITLKSKTSDLEFIIKYDGSTLPDNFIRASLESDGGFSWIIDPICYDLPLSRLRMDVKILDQLMINYGKDYPLKSAKRDGIISSKGAWEADKVYLNITIFGHEEDIAGKYFRLAYMQNGATLSGKQRNGIRIEEFDSSVYASKSDALIIHSSSDAEASYDRDAGGVQTFFITPKLRPNIIVKVTLNVDALPQKGTAFTSGNLPSSSLWSWIIDPSCYAAIPKMQVEPQKSITGIMAIGASLISSVNGWFEKSCSKMNLICINKAVGGKTPYYHADRIFRGTFCTDSEFENADILTIQYASSKDLDNQDGTLPIYTDYTKDFDVNNVNEQFSTKYTHAQTLDYILKYWRQRCYEQRNIQSSKWFGTKFGKPFRVVFVTHWHDARSYYNEPIRNLATRWGSYVCELDKNIGFTKLNPMPDGSQVSLMYAMDTENIEGIVYGWHPSRNDEGEYIQMTMCNIFESTITNCFL